MIDALPRAELMTPDHGTTEAENDAETRYIQRKRDLAFFTHRCRLRLSGPLAQRKRGYGAMRRFLLILGLAITLISTTTGSTVAFANDADLVAEGQLLRQDDATRATVAEGASRAVNGATIRLMWDTNAEAEQPGKEAVPVATLATTRADATGHYALRAEPTAEIARAAAKNDGWVNFMIAVTTDSGDFTVRHISRALADGRWTGKDRDEFEPSKDVPITMAYDQGGKLLNGGRATATAAAVQKGDVGAAACSYIVLDSWAQSTRIGNFHNTHLADGSWQYGATADSDIEAGIAYSNEPWSISGTYHIGNSKSGTEVHRTSNDYDRYIRTNFEYEYRLYSSATCGGAFTVIIAVDWAGGAQDDGNTLRLCTDSALRQYRITYHPGDSINKTATRATKIGFAIDAGPISLGQTSGYSTRMDFYWNVKRGNAWFCGLRDFPMGSSPGPGVVYNMAAQ